ncbi:uncharacterized protein LOC111677422 isoform X1 [Lucilia cuprina]|uniref:uncharacterized protein LOC111677422 isoform X1 n=1 Tax=Lucilia cuprina TaxID=7375 RepID=UPI001F05BCF7|nr:uncharacterized protein LOC111677422 isoform X1 [Lucilia cuprina]
MAQYYQIQNLDDLKQIYADVQVVHVASDDVGVSNPNRAQQIVLDETQQILLQNDGPQQVVYQTQGTPTQYQPPQAGTHYTILGEDMNQPQAQTVQHQQVQQVQQQQAQTQQQHQQAPQQQQQQQVLMHQQHHQVLDPQQQQQQQQQHQLQAAYQMPQETLQQAQHMQPQDHQMQQHVQAQPQQIYYTTDQLVHQQQQQQQQKKVYIQQQPQQLQQQYQPHPQHQQQMIHQAPPPPQAQQQPQQHILQSPQHHPQQVQVQHQVSPSHQQQTQQQPQIIYRMQPQQTQQLQQLIVQQPSGQQVLIQQPQQQELIMRQSMPPQRIIYNNRVLYSTPQQSPQQQQHTVMGQSPQTHQQQHILQTTHTTMQQHHNPTHLVQQTRVVPSQHQQQQTQQQTPPPQPQQQMQQNVVYQQIQVQNQMPKTLMQQQQPTQNSPQHQQHIQLQQQQQQQQTQMVTQAPNPNGATIIRAGVARGGKIGRGAMSGTLIARMPGMAGVARAEIRPGFNAAGAIGGGGGQILRTPRPRCSTTAGSTSRGRGRGARGAAANVTAGRGSPILANNQQLGTLQQGKIVTQSLPNQGIRQVYRTQVNDPNLTVQQQQHQQVHLVQAQPRMPGVASRFRSPAIGAQQQQHQQSPSESGQQTPSSSSSSAAGAGGGGAGLGDLDLEDSIQAVFVKKDAQQPKVAGAPNQSPTTVLSSGNSTPVSGTTLTTYYTAKDDDENRMIRTQNGTCMSLAEFKKRNANASGNQIIQNAAAAGGIKPLQQTAGGAKISLPAAGQSVHSVPVARVAPQKHIVNKEQGGAGGVAPSVAGAANATSSSVTNPQIPSGPPAGSSVYQTSHNNYEIQTQHVLQNRAGQQMAEKDRNSAKMLVILVSGEQRLITFTLPRESCTVQDLLEQVGVPFDNSTTIQCVENPGANIDFVVTVGFSVQESPSELISRAEQSLQISRQQESMQQNAAAAVTGSQPAAAAGSNTTEGNAQNNAAATTAASAAATAPNIAQTTENSTKEPNNSKQATTANAATTSAASSTSKATEELPQRKLIQGFYAICQSCGFSGYDHAKCERCKRVFMEPPKKIPIKQATASPSLGSNFANSNNSGSADSPTPSSTAPPIEKKRHSETAAQRGKSSLAYNPNAPTSTRGRGGSQAARGRGSRSGRRAAEIEPVILTLSSDEEDDESSNKGNSTMAALAKPSNTSSSASLASYKPFSFEPNMPDPDESALYNDFTRGDVTDLTNCVDKMSCSLACKLIRFGTYRFEPTEQVIITSLGIRIVAPLETNPSELFALNIYKHEVVKIIAHFSKSSSANSMLCFYTLRNCAQYIQKSLNMTEVAKHLDGVTYFSANGPYQIRKIILQFDVISEQAKSVIRSIWDFLDEISETDAQDLLQRAADSDKKLANNKNNSENIPTTTQLQPNEIRQLLIYPPGKGGISINTEDYMCLATDQYLNDIIIDFYLKWVHDNVIPEAQKERTHIFSTFFYKRLTTLTRHTHHDKDGGKLTPAQKRHARVQNWTKNVNLFEKDFIVIPINEQSHWFLAIICFPRLKGPVTFDTNTPVELQPIKKNKGKKVSLQIGNTTITPLSKRDSASVLSEICGVGDDDSERDEAEGDDSDLASEDSDFDNTSSSTTLNSSQPATPLIPGTATTSTHQPIKQPLILIFDSLAGASRSRVVATLRDYLTCEYKIKMTGAPLHTFNKDNMPGHCVKVPQQNNFTDCGLYLLQYVEHFFKDPIRDYRVPIKQLAQWFDTLTVTRKREDISNLLQKLMNERNGPNNKIILPEIPFPTLNGQLVEPEGYNIEFEEEEMEDDDEEENTTGDMDELSTDDTSKSKTPIKMPTTTSTVAATATTTTAAALVPTQGRKIVVKRRMQISGSSELNSSQVNAVAAATTCGTPPATSTATSTHQRTSSMAKIRKVES